MYETIRLTDNDKRFGPVTWGRTSWKRSSCVWHQGLTVYFCGIIAHIQVPRALRTVGEYGVSLSDGFFNLYYGLQTMDSRTEKRWGYFLPWTQWRFVRCSFYDLEGRLFANESRQESWEEREALLRSVPKVSFEVEDVFDKSRITAETYIVEREWKFGTGWWKWLSWFRSSKVSRMLDISFDAEVGPDKGSFKGGLMGHGIEMLPGELHEAAFARYTQTPKQAKNGQIKMILIAKV